MNDIYIFLKKMGILEKYNDVVVKFNMCVENSCEYDSSDRNSPQGKNVDLGGFSNFELSIRKYFTGDDEPESEFFQIRINYDGFQKIFGYIEKGYFNSKKKERL